MHTETSHDNAPAGAELSLDYVPAGDTEVAPNLTTPLIPEFVPEFADGYTPEPAPRRPLRIVDISSFYSDSCGGIKTYFREKARHLPAMGFDCHFIVPGKEDRTHAFENSTMHRLAGPPQPGGQYRYFGSLKRLKQLIQELQPDIIEMATHYVISNRLRGWIDDMPADKRPGVVGFFHSDIVRTELSRMFRKWPSSIRRGIERAGWQYVEKRFAGYNATAVASHELKTLLDGRRFPRTHVTGLGVDTSVFHPPVNAASLKRTSKKIVFVGRLSSEKGLNVVRDAFESLPRHLGAELEIIGEGPMRKSLEAWAAKTPGVTLRGYLSDRTQLANCFSLAQVVIAPAGIETFSLSTAEAMSCGTPVVAPNVGGAGELVQRSGAGLTYAFDDADACAAAIEALLNMSHAERNTMGARGRTYVAENHTWTVVMEKLARVYETVANNRSSGLQRPALPSVTGSAECLVGAG